MKTTLMLIRHGETEWNILGKFQGCTDIELSKDGIKQAQLLSEKLNGDFDIIYASPLNRAYKTAEILAETANKEVIVAKDIREIGFGEWEGLTIKGIAEKYPDVFNSWRTDKLEGNFIGGDCSILNASKRATKCILDIVKENKGKKIVIVAHGGIIKAGLIGLFDWDMTMYHKIRLGNTSVNTLIFNDELKPCICSLNDTSHLEEEVTFV